MKFRLILAALAADWLAFSILKMCGLLLVPWSLVFLLPVYSLVATLLFITAAYAVAILYLTHKAKNSKWHR